MSLKKRGLAQGRGLDALLGSIKQARAEVSELQVAPSDTILTDLALDCLQRGVYQPRREIAPEALQELAESIKRKITRRHKRLMSK